MNTFELDVKRLEALNELVAAVRGVVTNLGCIADALERKNQQLDTRVHYYPDGQVAHYPPRRYDPLHRQTDFDPPGAPNKE